MNAFAVGGFVANILLAALLGHFVLKGYLRVFITRKIIHITFYLLPFIVLKTVPAEYLQNYGPSLALMAFLKLVLYMKPVRSRSRLLTKAFASLDRPEDQPYTLALLSVQKVMHLVILYAGKYFYPGYMSERVFYDIAYLTLALGDGLAEPIGRLVKSPRYKTFSIFPTRGNYRTVAGSSCVFVTTFLLIYYMYPTHGVDFYLQLLIVPVVATAIEAMSPSTLDAAFLFFGIYFCQAYINHLYILATV